ncbi:hypothetical protein HOY82DRAFT_603315 [Tuber indicum]|nr:hypothetical protein HOY82DRAFT_603315 [Tuber indicum]
MAANLNQFGGSEVGVFIPGDYSGNRGDSNVIGNNNIITTNNYSSFPSIPATLKELVSGNHWGVQPPEIDLEYLLDPYNLPQDGTGEWIFKDRWYKKWQESDKPELLWLCGGPGIGKTMLAKRVAAKFLKGHSDLHERVKFVYHFVSPELPTGEVSADEADSRRRLAKVPWDLLYGILEQNGNLFDNLKAELGYQGEKLLTNPESLWKVLRKAIQNCGPEPVYILIDGVDGFKEGLCQELVQRIKGLMDIHKVKIFLSSRDVPHVSNNLPKHTKIELDKNELVKGDVETFIRSRVGEFEDWNGDQRTSAIKTLLEKSEGSFLWASLAVEILGSSGTGPNYEIFLEKLPLELGDIYRKMLENVQSRGDSEKVLRIIRSVALAFRPLTFGEFGHILVCIEAGAETGHSALVGGTGTEAPPRTEEEIKRYIRPCLTFLRVGAGTVSIVHHTAIDYLFEETLQGSIQVPHRSKLDFKVSWECFRYLHCAFTGSEESPNEGNGQRPGRFLEPSPERDHQEGPAEPRWETARRNPQGAVDKWPYLRYAAECWLLHARRSIGIAEDGLWGDSNRNWLEHQFFDASDTVRKPWIELCGDPKMKVLEGDQTPLNVVVCLGLKPLVGKALLDYNAGTRGTNDKQSPLHLAAKFISGAYEALIAMGSQSLITTLGQYDNTPLHEAAISGHRPMLQGLEKIFRKLGPETYSEQINKQNEFGDTPLHLAVRFDHPDIVDFLVKNRADHTIRNRDGVTPLELGEELRRGDSVDILEQVGKFRGAGEEIVETMTGTAEGNAERNAEGDKEGDKEGNAAEPRRRLWGGLWRRLCMCLRRHLGGYLGRCLGSARRGAQEGIQEGAWAPLPGDTQPTSDIHT